MLASGLGLLSGLAQTHVEKTAAANTKCSASLDFFTETIVVLDRSVSSGVSRRRGTVNTVRSLRPVSSLNISTLTL